MMVRIEEAKMSWMESILQMTMTTQRVQTH